MASATDLNRTIEELCVGGELDELASTVGKAFESWRTCRAPGDPVDERLVLAWLVDNSHWAWRTSRTSAWALDRYYRRSEGVSLIGQHVLTYLARKRQRDRTWTAPTEPLRSSDVSTISAQLHVLDDSSSQGPDALLALRHGLAVLRRCAAPTATLRTGFASLAQMRLKEASGKALLLDGEGGVVDVLRPEQARLWEQHLCVLLDRTRTMRRGEAAAARCGLTMEQKVQDMTEEHWEWMWRMLDPSAPRRLRDRAYLLLGFSHARRHAELRRLRIEDVTAMPDGFAVRYWDAKKGAELHRAATHQRDGAGCVAHCIACAVAELLYWERSCMRRTTGPLLATRYRGTVGMMTRQNGRLRVQHLTGLVSDHPWGSTRSLRAGAATSAWEAGWSLDAIATQVTDHSSVDLADLYIRRCATPGRTVQLRLGGPVD